MTNIIFLFGTFAGLIVIAGIIGTIVAAGGSPNMSDHNLWLGYLIMFVALSMIFFGVKRYRDQDLGGVIKFLPAFLMGLGIAIVAGIIYVLVWEVYMAATNYTFMDVYVTAVLDAERAKGTSPDKIAAMAKELEYYRVHYKDPLFRMPLTFLEIFPVGLLIALFSAALLQFPRVLPARA
ncbi:MAG: DUF4199 domain-containing protein [Alphaproteobacteria bacterium]|nr:DUF4199 domain-containing protein [Alphaproteobacteria bacterium]